jgi:hypothetical protein
MSEWLVVAPLLLMLWAAALFTVGLLGIAALNWWQNR